MGTAGLAEAAHERLVGGIEEDELDLVTALDELLDDLADAFEERPGSDVDPEAHAADRGRHLVVVDAALRAGLLPALEEIEETGEERWGEVVDAEEAEVLEDVERRAAPRAAHSGDDHDVERVIHRAPRLRGAARRRAPRRARRRSGARRGCRTA